MKTRPTLLRPHRPLRQTFPAPNVKEKEKSRKEKRIQNNTAKAGTTTYLGNHRPRPSSPSRDPSAYFSGGCEGVHGRRSQAGSQRLPRAERRCWGFPGWAAARSRAPETLACKTGSNEARSIGPAGSPHQRPCAAPPGFPRSRSRAPGGCRGRSWRTPRPAGSAPRSLPTATPGMLSECPTEGEAAYNFFSNRDTWSEPRSNVGEECFQTEPHNREVQPSSGRSVRAPSPNRKEPF